MKVFEEVSISNFKTWSGAKSTQERIIECDKENEFDQLIEELYPDGIEDGQLNDILWFESEWIYELLGITEEEEEEEDQDDEE